MSDGDLLDDECVINYKAIGDVRGNSLHEFPNEFLMSVDDDECVLGLTFYKKAAGERRRNSVRLAIT